MFVSCVARWVVRIDITVFMPVSSNIEPRVSQFMPLFSGVFVFVFGVVCVLFVTHHQHLPIFPISFGHSFVGLVHCLAKREF